MPVCVCACVREGHGKVFSIMHLDFDRFAWGHINFPAFPHQQARYHLIQLACLRVNFVTVDPYKIKMYI